jgi:hypothetical protein
MTKARVLRSPVIRKPSRGDDVRLMAEALQEDENWAVSWMVTPEVIQ